MCSPNAIRAVLFDADGVLQRSGAFPDYVRDRLGWSEEDFRGFLTELFAHPLYEGCLEGRSTFLEVIEAVLDSRTCPVAPQEFMGDWHRIGIAAVPDAFDLVAQLRASGVICALATNQDPERAAFMDEALGYARCFDHSFYSCRVGVKKPSPAYFRHALATLDLPPAAVLFLDDHPANVAAAQKIGINAEIITPSSDLAEVVRSYGLLENVNTSW